MDLKILEEYSKQSSPEKIKNLEDVLLRISKEIPLATKTNTRLGKTIKRIFKRETQSYLDELYRKVSLVEELERNKKLIKSMDQASINLIAYRPENIKMLLQYHKELLTKLKREVEERRRSVSTSEAYRRAIYDTFRRFGGGCYFKLSEYHDSFVYKICNALAEENLAELEKLLEKGFEHIVWTNICESALQKIAQFANPKITLESYPDQFFNTLITIETNLPLIKVRNVKELYHQTLVDVFTVGGYGRVGRHSFNWQKLENRCKEYLSLLPSRTAKLIENYYLATELSYYGFGLSRIRALTESSMLRANLEELKKDVENAIKSLPTSDYRTAYSLWAGLKDQVSKISPSFPLSKQGLEHPYSLYWSLYKRKSLNYTAATILLECLCRIQHDFPVEKWISFEHLDAEQAKLCSISEIPTKEEYKKIARRFGLSPRILREYHTGTMFVCRAY
jgi:hypothetical protein